MLLLQGDLWPRSVAFWHICGRWSRIWGQKTSFLYSSGCRWTVVNSLWPRASPKGSSEVPIFRASLAESLPSNWPDEIQRHHLAAAGPCGDRNGGRGGGETKTKHAFLLLHQLPASHSPCILGMTLCPKAHLDEKRSSDWLKTMSTNLQRTRLWLACGRGSLRPGVGTRWGWEIAGDLTGTSSEQNPSEEVTCSLKVALVFNQTRLFNLSCP